MKKRFILWIKKKLRIHSPSEILTHEDLEEMGKLFLKGYFEGTQKAEQALKEREGK